ncbi:MAG: pentapeptide repeat-containing protein [Chloroflexi bacterium]|nr:pentapeptide repeat-containing protein [Chloroflexota bacterium]
MSSRFRLNGRPKRFLRPSGFEEAKDFRRRLVRCELGANPLRKEPECWGLERANLHGANPCAADLHSARLDKANLRECNLQNADLRYPRFRARICVVRGSDGDLSAADLSGRVVGGRDHLGRKARQIHSSSRRPSLERGHHALNVHR